MHAIHTPRINRARAKLDAGASAFGTLSLLPEPAIPELLGAIGLDFYIIDTEHVGIDGQHLVHMIRACNSSQISPIVRVRHVEEKEFLWVLDSGAQGIMIPLIEDAAVARRAAALAHFPPEGDRTHCSASRAAAHGAYRYNLEPYLKHSNATILLIGLIETIAGMENIKSIVKEGIDVFCVGRGDLSIKLGFPYAPLHPKVTDAAKRILDPVLEAGKVGSIVAHNLEDARMWMEYGCRFIIYSQPEKIIAQGYLDALAGLNAIVESHQSGSRTAPAAGGQVAKT